LFIWRQTETKVSEQLKHEDTICLHTNLIVILQRHVPIYCDAVWV